MDTQRNLLKKFGRRIQDSNQQLTTDVISEIITNEGSKYFSQLLTYGGEICQPRSLLYAYMCGSNNFEITETEL